MKPFSLDTVLSYRERLEDLAKNKLAEALQAHKDAQKVLSDLEADYQEKAVLIEKVQMEGVGINDLIRLEEHLAYTKQRIAEERDTLEQRRKDVEKSRLHLLDKSRERQVMEKLKEKQNDAWKQHLNKKEAAFLDEIAIVFHDKK